MHALAALAAWRAPRRLPSSLPLCALHSASPPPNARPRRTHGHSAHARTPARIALRALAAAVHSRGLRTLGTLPRARPLRRSPLCPCPQSRRRRRLPCSHARALSAHKPAAPSLPASRAHAASAHARCTRRRRRRQPLAPFAHLFAPLLSVPSLSSGGRCKGTHFPKAGAGSAGALLLGGLPPSIAGVSLEGCQGGGRDGSLARGRRGAPLLH